MSENIMGKTDTISNSKKLKILKKSTEPIQKLHKIYAIIKYWYIMKHIYSYTFIIKLEDNIKIIIIAFTWSIHKMQFSLKSHSDYFSTWWIF